MFYFVNKQIILIYSLLQFTSLIEICILLRFYLRYLPKTVQISNFKRYLMRSVEMVRAVYLIFLNAFLLPVHSDRHAISKRALLFQRLTFFQFSVGLTVPLVLPRRSINFSMCAQNNYNIPYKLSSLQPMTIPARHYNNFLGITRETFYEYIMNYLDSFGLEGEACLLRAICEIAETPMHVKDEDTLLEKIVQYIFTPSLEMYAQVQNATSEENLGFVEKLLLAEKTGKGGGQCDEQYSDCLVSIVDIFSTKYVM